MTYFLSLNFRKFGNIAFWNLPPNQGKKRFKIIIKDVVRDFTGFWHHHCCSCSTWLCDISHSWLMGWQCKWKNDFCAILCNLKKFCKHSDVNCVRQKIHKSFYFLALSTQHWSAMGAIIVSARYESQWECLCRKCKFSDEDPENILRLSLFLILGSRSNSRWA